MVLKRTVFGLGATLVACAWIGNHHPSPPDFRVWPAPPDPPRIQLIQVFGSPSDLGFPQSFWTRIAEILFGSSPPRMYRPYAVAVRGDLAVVSDTKIGAVHVFDMARKDYRQLGRGIGGLVSPVGLAIDRLSRIWVTDSVLAQVRVYRSDGALENTITTFGRPTGVAYDERRRVVWVADTARHEIIRLDESGNHVGSAGGRGLREGQLNFPTHLAFRGDKLFVTDTMNFRIQILDGEGHPLDQFGRHGDGTGDFAMPKGVAADGDGNVYVSDALFGAFQVFDSKGALLLGVGGTGTDTGLFALPSGLFVDEQDRIWVADSYNSRVQVFQYLRDGSRPSKPPTRTGWSWPQVVRSAFAVSDVSSTVHNLSTSGPGPTKSATVDQVCVFCHTPHNSQPVRPLWNRSLSGSSYTLYSSSTLDAAPDVPTGSARLCLSCHDGTVALGSITNAPYGQSRDLLTTFVTGRAMLSSNLSDDHPISFTYDAGLVALDPELKDPATLTGVKLENGQVQCVSCHEPHDMTNSPFLRVSSTSGALCTSCHTKAFWSTSAHATSAKTWNGVGEDPWSDRKPAWKSPTVSGNACFNCHDPHTAEHPVRLLKKIGDEETTCFLCHNTNVATKNIQGEFAKAYRHPVAAQTDVHNPTESPLTMGSHVECLDCHNPHVVDATALAASPYAAPLQVSGRNRKVKGIDTNGNTVAEATFIYEICYKCHGVSNTHTTNFANVIRLDGVYSIRQKFDTANPSYMPVEAAGKNASVPSLIAPYTTASIISCLDCHNSNVSPWIGGAGPNGPHGSTQGPGIFMRAYLLQDNQAFVQANYNLCFRCHNWNELRSDSSFKHKRHMENANAACMDCHDPHGSTVYTHNINFMKRDRFGNTIVQAVAPNPEPIFQDLGLHTGRCYLVCHGQTHNPRVY